MWPPPVSLLRWGRRAPGGCSWRAAVRTHRAATREETLLIGWTVQEPQHQEFDINMVRILHHSKWYYDASVNQSVYQVPSITIRIFITRGFSRAKGFLPARELKDPKFSLALFNDMNLTQLYCRLFKKRRRKKKAVKRISFLISPSKRKQTRWNWVNNSLIKCLSSGVGAHIHGGSAE